MSFISRSELKELLPNAEGGITDAQFDAINKAVSELIIDLTGIAMPDSPAVAPAWSKFPAALLFHRISTIKQSKPTPESLEDSRANYKQAVEILSRHVSANKTTSPKFVNIKERYKW